MALRGPDAAAAQASKVLAYFRDTSRPVVHVQHVATEPGATFFVPDTDGAVIHQSVAPRAGEDVITKHFPNSFRETTLLERLRELDVDELVVAGMMTHMCVDSTVRAAYDFGFSCQVVADACATLDQSFGEATVAAAQVQASFLSALDGTFADVVMTESVLGG